MEIEPAALHTALQRLRRGHEGDGVQPALRDVCTAAVALFDVAGSGLMIVDEGAVLRYVTASDPAGRILEKVQEETGEGPCVETLIFDHVVTAVDVSTDERWPRLARRMADTPVRAVLGVPTRINGTAVGSLNIYRSAPHRWTDSEVDALRAFNGVVESLLTTAILAEAREEIVGQLQHALEHRVVIERAVGVIIGRRGVDAVAAFNHLRDRARAQRRKVAEVAAAIVAEAAAQPR